jgi:hypothetical protein
VLVRSANSNGRTAQAGRSRARSTGVRVVIASVRDIRRALSGAGDIAADVAFQNDVNVLLAAVARLPAAEAADLAQQQEQARARDELAERPTPAPRRLRVAASVRR